MKMEDKLYIDFETLKRLEVGSGYHKNLVAAGVWHLMERGEEVTLEALKKEADQICSKIGWPIVTDYHPTLEIFPAYAANRLIGQGKELDFGSLRAVVDWKPETKAERARFGSVPPGAKFKYTRLGDGFYLTTEFPVPKTL